MAILFQLYDCFEVVFATDVEEEEVRQGTSMVAGCKEVFGLDGIVDIWMGDITPEEMLRFRATCRDVQRFATAEDVQVAKFAISRWLYAGGSLSFWRGIWRECVLAAALRGWDANVWFHAELMIAADDSKEFNGWCRFRWPTDCTYDDLWVPARDDRVTLVQGLEEHLTFSTQRKQEVVAILAIFMLCSHCRESWYWAFMALLSDGYYAAVRIEDYANTPGIDCAFSLTPDKLRRWSIDDGGRVLMNMDIGCQFPDGLRPDFEDFLHTLTESMIRIGRHKRRAHDGVAYTWTEFVEWYGHVQVAYEPWRRACPISFGYEMKLMNSSDGRHGCRMGGWCGYSRRPQIVSWNETFDIRTTPSETEAKNK